VTPIDWANAFTAAVNGVETVGGATLGDCTMLDALLPASVELARELKQDSDPLVALFKSLTAAKEGAAATVNLRASLGRSSYIGDRAMGHVDPGAYAVTLWLEAVQETLQTAVATGAYDGNLR
jgi:dihydroxyacetone kinase